ncbi:putative MFS-type transporter C18.02 [Hypsizygus marmoreus]|uniref:MFS-type transporter C18.02 n=1 Tax=Hypsizygus marmoreus TaxID=39966 RepID=A0A369KCT8_HYPMA|nr:putative MFS-type transporter C18.02 [Hypsizygus marmoreus]
MPSYPSETTTDFKLPPGRPPIGLKWRSSYWFVTFLVGLGVATDLLVYSIIIPVMPFQLQKLGYTGVSALSGWLLFAYSAGLVVATIPIAMFSERYNARRWPLIIGLLILVGSQIMLMEAPIYAVMCIARILQGVGSSMVWVVGLAFLCDSTPEQFVGRQLGLAMAGLSIGVVIGPPVGGALYSRFGFRGPFIFGLGATVIDLLARIVAIERNEALRWGLDPWRLAPMALATGDAEAAQGEKSTEAAKEPSSEKKSEVNLSASPITGEASVVQEKRKPLSLLAVIIKLSKSPRAVVASIITLLYGIIYTSQEPAIPLHLQSVWGFNSEKVGLVFLAAVVPTIFSSSLSGWYADHKGPEWLVFGCTLLALPWWVVVIIRGPVALFIVAFAIEMFFTSGILSPLTAELAAVSRGIEGVGYAHVYGAFNLAYGIGSAVGPVAGGQIYDHVKHGWTALCLLAAGLLAASLVLGFFYVGANPLSSRLTRYLRRASRTEVPE